MTIQPHTVTPDALDAATTVIIDARDDLARLVVELRVAEISVIRAKKELAKALDNRRLLEAIMRLDENSREDYAA